MSVNYYDNGKLTKLAGVNGGNSYPKLDTLNEVKNNNELGKVADALAIKEGLEQVNLIKEDAKGKEITVNDSTNAKLVTFNLHGQSTQKSYSGKNLLKNDANSKTQNGVSFTVNNDGSVTVNGTSTNDTYLVLSGGFSGASKLPPWLEKGKAYVVSDSLSEHNNGRVNMVIYRKDNQAIEFLPNTAQQIPNEENLTYGVFIFIYKKQTLNNVTFYPMIRKADIQDDTYEPYVGAKPSPSPDYPQDIITSGESYNLLENIATTPIIDGITVTINSDKSVTLNGTSTKNSNEFSQLRINSFNANGNYILNGCPKGGSKNTFFLGLVNTKTWATYYDYGDGLEFSVNENLRYNIDIFVQGGQTLNNLTFYPMIRKATETRTRYMPYKKGSVEVVSGGKNLFSDNDADCAKKISFENGVYTTSDGDTRPLAFLKLQQYDENKNTISGATEYRISSPIIGRNNAKIKLTDSKTKYLRFANGGKTSEFTLYIDVKDLKLNKDYNFSLNIIDLTQGATKFRDVQIEEGSVATPYVPYQKITSIIPTPDGLNGIKVTSGGNYTDENGQQWITDELVKYEDGSGKYIKRIGREVFDGSETWYAISSGDKNKLRMSSGKIADKTKFYNYSQKPIAFSTIYKGVTADESYLFPINTFMIGQTGNFIICDEKYFASTTEYKQWLTQNPMTLIYALKTPQEIPLTSEQLAEIEKLKTFYPTTHITNDGVCGMEMKYHVDTKQYIDNNRGLKEIPQATETVFGGIKASPKTSAETSEVKIDTKTGKLYTKASSGGNGQYGYSELTPTTETYSVKLNANTLYNIKTIVSELNILFEPLPNAYAEYLFTFKTSSSGCNLTLPASVMWNGDKIPTIEANKKYEVSVLNDIAVISGGVAL